MDKPPYLSGGDQPFSYSIFDQFAATVQAKFSHQVFTMSGDSMAADRELVANLIVAETAARYRVDLSFWTYTKPGFIITLITLALNTGWLYLIR